MLNGKREAAATSEWELNLTALVAEVRLGNKLALLLVAGNLFLGVRLGEVGCWILLEEGCSDLLVVLRCEVFQW